eukprot:jgi/Mesvir1/6836/Mv09016-RA.1
MLRGHCKARSGRKCFSPDGNAKLGEGRVGRSQPQANRPAVRKSAVVSSLGKISDVGRDSAPFERDLAVGDSGEDVRGLRTLMRHMGYIHAPPDPSDDSLFDITLKEAVQAWQADHALPSSGYFGPMSRELLLGQQEGVGIVSAVTGGHFSSPAASPGARQAAKQASSNSWPTIKSQSTYLTSTAVRPPGTAAPHISPQVITSVAVIMAAGIGAVIARGLGSQAGMLPGQEDAGAAARPPKPRLSLSSAARARVNGAMQAARSNSQPAVGGASGKKKVGGDASPSSGWGLQPLLGLGMAALSGLASPLKGIFAPRGDKNKTPVAKGAASAGGAGGPRPRLEKRSLASEFEAQVDGKSRLADIPSKVALGIVEKCLEELEMKEYEMQDRLRAMEDRMVGMESALEAGGRPAVDATVDASLAQAEKLIAGLQTRLSRTEAALADATERGYERGQALNDRLMAIEGALDDMVPLLRGQIAELQRKVGAGASGGRSLTPADASVLDEVAERVDLALSELTSLAARVRSVEEAPRGGGKSVAALEVRVNSVEEHLSREMEEAMHKLDVVAEVVEEVARLSKEQQDAISRSPPSLLANVTGDIVKRLEAVEGRVGALDRAAAASSTGPSASSSSYVKDMAELRGRVGELEEALEAALESMDAGAAMDVISVLERKVEELEASVGKGKGGVDAAESAPRKEEKAV